MTVSSIIPVNNYTGNGSSSTFDFDFLIENENELTVTHKNINTKAETVLKHGIDYSINEISNKNGSYITFPMKSSAYGILSSDEMISISLSLPVKQESEFGNSSNLNLSVLEWTFDYIVRILQILTRKVERAVKIKEGESVSSEEFINELYTAKNESVNSSEEAKISAEKAEYYAEKVKGIDSEFYKKANVDMDNLSAEGINKIREFTDDGSSLPIGIVFAVTCGKSYVPDGCLPCDGAEYDKSLFPDLWSNYLIVREENADTLLNTCTYEDYSADLASYGQCGKFAVDTVNEKFKVPYIKDGAVIQQALSDSELGKSYNAGLPNITGTMGTVVTGSGYDSYNEGALYLVKNSSGSNTFGSTSGSRSIYGFDASLSDSIYGASDTVQPNAVALRYFVVVANGKLNQSAADWSAWVSVLSGKVNKDHSNDEKPYVTETYKNEGSWYRVWSDGWCEQGFLTHAGMITFLKTYGDTNYTINATQVETGSTSNQYFGTVKFTELNTDTAVLSVGQNENPLISVDVKGYLQEGEY